MQFVFDVDGTISFNGATISDVIVTEIKKLERLGNTVTFASARPIRDLLPIIPNFTDNHLLIGGNGAIVQRPDNQIVSTRPIDSTSFRLIKELINTYKLNYIIDDSWNYSAKVDLSNKIYKQLDPGHLAKNVKISSLKAPIKIILLGIPNELFVPLLGKLERQPLLSIIVHSGENNLDITAIGINKLSTLRNFYSHEYIAFGNDSNDLELLDNAKLSMWVENKDICLQKQRINISPDYIVNNSVEDVANIIKQLGENESIK